MSDSSSAWPTDADKLAPPSGVRYVVVLLATAMAILLYLDRFCLSISERAIKADLFLTNFQTELLLSAFSVTYALGQVPSGWFSDRFGARRMLALYIVVWSVFTGVIGLAESFLALLLLRFGVGLAQAGAYPTSANLISKWVPFAARGRASGIVSAGGRVGAVAAPLLTPYLMAAFVGFTTQSWRPTMFVYGLVGLGVAALFWVLVRDQPQDHPACNSAELALIEEGRPPGISQARGRAGGLPLAAIVSSRSLWCSSLSQFGTNLGWAFLTFLLPRYLAEVYDVPIVTRGWMTGAPIFFGMFGMLAGGFVTDALTRRLGLRWGRSLPIVGSRVLAVAAFLTCLALDAPWPTVVALSLVAVATDLGTASVWGFMQDIGGRHVGSVLGWGNMWGNFGALLSPVLLGRVAEHYGWNTCFLCCAGAYLLSGVMALGVDATRPILPPDEPHGRLEELALEEVETSSPPDEHIQRKEDRIQRGD